MEKLFVVPIAVAILAGCTNQEIEAETVSTAESQAGVSNAPTIDQGNKVATTIGIENSDQWVEEAADVTDAASGDDYVINDFIVLSYQALYDEEGQYSGITRLA